MNILNVCLGHCGVKPTLVEGWNRCGIAQKDSACISNHKITHLCGSFSSHIHPPAIHAHVNKWLLFISFNWDQNVACDLIFSCRRYLHGLVRSFTMSTESRNTARSTKTIFISSRIYGLVPNGAPLSLKPPGCNFWNTSVGSYFFATAFSFATLADP